MVNAFDLGLRSFTGSIVRNRQLGYSATLEGGMSNRFEIRSICEICEAKVAMTDAKNQDTVLTFDSEESAIEDRDKLLSKSWELELSILGANYHECPECHVIRPTHELKLFIFRQLAANS